ncbi:MAG: rod-binding protein [Planctomycetota bacterium]
MTDPIAGVGAAAQGQFAQRGLGDLQALVDRSDELDEKQLNKVAEKLEGLFVSMMVKTMRESASEEGLFGEGSEGEIYGGFFDQMIGEGFAKNGGLGIAELVVRSAWGGDRSEPGRGKGAVDAVPVETLKLKEEGEGRE